MTSNFQHMKAIHHTKLRIFAMPLLIFFFLIAGCSDTNSSEYSNESYNTNSKLSESRSSDFYEDGTYCAEITYYNPNTGTRKTYTLNVEVENNEVTVIHWPNGGWLDESHFNPEELDRDGSCSFTNDRGYIFDIQITGPECSYTDSGRVRSDFDDEKEMVTCPKCGEDKDTYDEYCYWCTRKIKDKEEHTCPKCGNYDSFMFSTDSQCSDCKRKEEEENDRENEENQDLENWIN